MTIFASRQQRRALEAENRRHSDVLRAVPKADWPDAFAIFARAPTAVWRSREFLVQVFEHEGTTRLSVCRTVLDGAHWKDGISWEQLQNLKYECGFGDKCAIELFPPDRDVVNVANMRHLWIVDAPAFMWKRDG